MNLIEQDAIPFTDYNTQRKKLVLPEYGRHIQRMIQKIAEIPDRERRNEQIMTAVALMGDLNPHLRDVNDFKHKLWDHVHIISDFGIDIDAPYPKPSRESFQEKPQRLPYPGSPVKIMHYGRAIQVMIDVLSDRPDNDERTAIALRIAGYMKRDYLLWNKDTVTDEIIIRDLTAMSKGRIVLPAGTVLPDVQADIDAEKAMMRRDAGSKKKKKKQKKKKKGGPGQV